MDMISETWPERRRKKKRWGGGLKTQGERVVAEGQRRLAAEAGETRRRGRVV